MNPPIKSLDDVMKAYPGINLSQLSARNPYKSCLICGYLQCGNHRMLGDSCEKYKQATLAEWLSYRDKDPHYLRSNLG
jgi:hypothetical protein